MEATFPVLLSDSKSVEHMKKCFTMTKGTFLDTGVPTNTNTHALANVVK